ncbi:MAG: hypothetical protein M1308_01310 [Actinobacteria bacterium]|nr:hypothetical protein [Actinomycetota bacterium]
MKLTVREIIKVIPGKWNEAIELHKKRVENATRLGSPPFKVYRSMSGQGDWSNTIILERQWDSFAAWETFFDKAVKDPKVNKEFIEKWQGIVQSHNFEYYTPLEI